MLEIAVKGGADLKKWADTEIRRIDKAMSAALKVEGYRLFKESNTGVMQNKLALTPLTNYMNAPQDKRFKKSRAKKARAPLLPLVQGRQYGKSGISYKAFTADQKVLVGFLRLGGRDSWKADVAAKSVGGYRWPITESRRSGLHKVGIHLRKTTSSIQVPSRDIMGTVLNRNKNISPKNIENNFERKMRGERI